MGHRREIRGCLQVIEGKFMDFLENVPKQVVQQHMCFQVCLQCTILLVGHFTCYKSPNLTLIK
jgi:hypothetical protein